MKTFARNLGKKIWPSLGLLFDVIQVAQLVHLFFLFLVSILTIYALNMSGIHVPLPPMEHNQGPGLGPGPDLCQGQGADPVPDQGREAVAGLLLLWVCSSVMFQNFVTTPLYNDEV